METENQNKTGEKMILAVSFGTSYPKRREDAIGGIERRVAGAFEDYLVCRAFTSGMVIRKIEREEGIHINTPKEALEAALQNGVQELVTLTTHVMDGIEYQKFMGVLKEYQSRFEKVTNVGPLVRNQEDLDDIILAVREVTAQFDDGHTAIVLIGHGTEDRANHIYQDLQERLQELSLKNYIVGTVEAEPSYDTVLEKMDQAGVSKAVLLPFMVVAGDHAINDLGGESEDSWKVRLEKEGYEVEVIQHGLGEFEKIQQIYVQHVKDALRG